MGNTACCEDNRTRPSNFEEAENQKQGGGIHEVNIHGEEAPELSQRVREAQDRQRFFQSQIEEQNNPNKRRYGDDFYTGELDQESRPNGFGRIYKNNGGYYIGNFQHGKAHGSGVFYFENGSFYHGEFHNNRAHSDKGRFESDEVTYEGGFRDNKFDGSGTQRGKRADYVYEGTYANGARERGVLTWKDDDGNYKYEGPFNEYNQFHGKGVLTEPNGTYEGGFVNGEKDGENCQYISDNGTRYEGSYMNGKRQGTGTIFKGDGSLAYKGEMKDGMPHGNGFIMRDNEQIATTWVMGIDSNLLPDNEQQE